MHTSRQRPASHHQEQSARPNQTNQPFLRSFQLSSGVRMAPARARVLCLVLVAALAAVAAPARAAWVDYPSGVPCGVTIPVEQCDPSDAAANSACMDMCHYGGCRRGGRCVSLGFGRGRGCNCKC